MQKEGAFVCVCVLAMSLIGVELVRSRSDVHLETLAQSS